MATEITVQKFGSTPNYVDVDVLDNTMYFINDSRTQIYVQQFSGVAQTIEFLEQEVCDFGHAPVNDTFVCQPGGVSRVWLTLNRFRYNDGAGKAWFTVTESAGIKVAAISLSPQES